ncbi:MAG: 6-phosphogluconolactonase, partial [Elusimicrobiota bacterium]|nr:6-phosphogluconolactonase [Elusimicrobiota bacterium]
MRLTELVALSKIIARVKGLGFHFGTNKSLKRIIIAHHDPNLPKLAYPCFLGVDDDVLKEINRFMWRRYVEQGFASKMQAETPFEEYDVAKDEEGYEQALDIDSEGRVYRLKKNPHVGMVRFKEPEGWRSYPVHGRVEHLDVAAIFPARTTEKKRIDADSLAQAISESIQELEKAKQLAQKDSEEKARSKLNRLLAMAAEITRTTYDRMTEKYAELRGEEPQGKDLEVIQEFLKRIRQISPAGSKVRILDGGTSLRDLAWLSKQKDISATGIDFSEKVVEFITKYKDREGKSLSVLLMDISNLKFDEESFEGVRSQATLHHLPLIDSQKGADIAVKEAYRVLKSGGIFYVYVKAETDERSGFMAIDTKEGLGKRFYQFYSKESLKMLLERNGFNLLGDIEPWTDERGEKNLIAFAQKPLGDKKARPKDKDAGRYTGTAPLFGLGIVLGLLMAIVKKWTYIVGLAKAFTSTKAANLIEVFDLTEVETIKNSVRELVPDTINEVSRTFWDRPLSPLQVIVIFAVIILVGSIPIVATLINDINCRKKILGLFKRIRDKKNRQNARTPSDRVGEKGLTRVKPDKLVDELLDKYKEKDVDIKELENVISPTARAVEEYLYKQVEDQKIEPGVYNKGMKNIIPNLASWFTDKSKDKATRDGIIAAVKNKRWEVIAQAYFDDIAFGTAGVRGRFAFDEDFNIMADAADKGMGLMVNILKGPNTFNNEVLKCFTLGVLRFLESKNQGVKKPNLKLFTGYDSRIAGREFAELIKKIGLAYGVTVYISDEVMPLPEFSCSLQELSGGKGAIGIFISASHNPKLDNGLKLMASDGRQMGAEPVERREVLKEFRNAEVKEVEKLLKTLPSEIPQDSLVFMGGTEKLEGVEYGKHKLIDTHTIHQKAVFKHIKDEKVIEKNASGLNILYCAFNGAGRKATPRMLEEKGFNVEVIEKMHDLNGRFPYFKAKENPDPALAQSWRYAIAAYFEDNTRDDLIKKDFFLSNDPDADRYGVVARVSADEIPCFEGASEAMGIVFKLTEKEQKKYGFRGFRVIPPNEAGALITMYDLNRLRTAGTLDSERHYIARSNVTSMIFQKIAKLFEIGEYVLPVGVDQIAALIAVLEAPEEYIIVDDTPEARKAYVKLMDKLFKERIEEKSIKDIKKKLKKLIEILKEAQKENVASIEESGTYFTGNHIRDKDGFLAGIRLAEIAAYARSQNKTLNDLLDEISLNPEIGLFATTNTPIEFEVSIPGTARKIRMVRRVHQRLLPYVKERAAEGRHIVVAGDKIFDADAQEEFRSGKYDDMFDYPGFPDAGIRFYFNEEKTSFITIRPSGTGPQVRFYVHLNLPIKEGMTKGELARLKKKAFLHAYFVTQTWMEIANVLTDTMEVDTINIGEEIGKINERMEMAEKNQQAEETRPGPAKSRQAEQKVSSLSLVDRARENVSGENDVLMRVYSNRQKLGKAEAIEVAKELKLLIRNNGKAVMVLAAAPSQDEFLDELAKRRGIDWSKVVFFHLDDYIGLSKEHKNTFKYYLNERFFDKLRELGAELNVHFIKDLTGTPEEICVQYSQLIEQEGGIDIACIGIGENGHIAFDDPGSLFFADELVNVAIMDKRCRKQQLRDYKDHPDEDRRYKSLDDVPRQAFTLTIPAILSANKIFCSVPGDAKKFAVRSTILGPVTHACPASLLKRHKYTNFYFDRDSASLLGKEFKGSRTFTSIPAQPKAGDIDITERVRTVPLPHGQKVAIVYLEGERAGPCIGLVEKLDRQANEIRVFYVKDSLQNLDGLLNELELFNPQLVVVPHKGDARNDIKKLYEEIVFKVQLLADKDNSKKTLLAYDTMGSALNYNLIYILTEDAYNKKMLAANEPQSQLKRCRFDIAAEATMIANMARLRSLGLLPGELQDELFAELYNITYFKNGQEVRPKGRFLFGADKSGAELSSLDIKDGQVETLLTHPDDEMAWAGILSELAARGCNVNPIYLTTGHRAVMLDKRGRLIRSKDRKIKIRKKEARKSIKKLGVKTKPSFLGLGFYDNIDEDGESRISDKDREKLYRKIESDYYSFIKSGKIGPFVIITNQRVDHHRDHRAAYDIGTWAARRLSREQKDARIAVIYGPSVWDDDFNLFNYLPDDIVDSKLYFSLDPNAKTANLFSGLSNAIVAGELAAKEDFGSTSLKPEQLGGGIAERFDMVEIIPYSEPQRPNVSILVEEPSTQRQPREDGGRFAEKLGRTPSAMFVSILLSNHLQDCLFDHNSFTFKDLRQGYDEVRKEFPILRFAKLPEDPKNDSQSRRDLASLEKDKVFEIDRDGRRNLFEVAEVDIVKIYEFLGQILATLLAEEGKEVYTDYSKEEAAVVLTILTSDYLKENLSYDDLDDAYSFEFSDFCEAYEEVRTKFPGLGLPGQSEKQHRETLQALEKRFYLSGFEDTYDFGEEPFNDIMELENWEKLRGHIVTCLKQIPEKRTSQKTTTKRKKKKSRTKPGKSAEDAKAESSAAEMAWLAKRLDSAKPWDERGIIDELCELTKDAPMAIYLILEMLVYGTPTVSGRAVSAIEKSKILSPLTKAVLETELRRKTGSLFKRLRAREVLSRPPGKTSITLLRNIFKKDEKLQDLASRFESINEADKTDWGHRARELNKLIDEIKDLAKRDKRVIYLLLEMACAGMDSNIRVPAIKTLGEVGIATPLIIAILEEKSSLKEPEQQKDAGAATRALKKLADKPPAFMAEIFKTQEGTASASAVEEQSESFEVKDVEAALERIKEVDGIMRIGKIDVPAEQIAEAMEKPFIPIVEEIADVFVTYLSLLSHIDGNYSKQHDSLFRGTPIYKRIVNSKRPVSEKDFKDLWLRSVRDVVQDDIDNLILRIPQSLLPDNESELEKWLEYFLANFRMLTMRRDKDTGKLLRLRRYTSAMIRSILIKTEAEEAGEVAGGAVDDKQALAHISRKCELAELCEALKKAGLNKEAKEIREAFTHALSITDATKKPSINPADSEKAIRHLIKIARQVTGNPDLSIADLLKSGYTKRLTRHWLGYMHPELPFKDKTIERAWNAAIFALHGTFGDDLNFLKKTLGAKNVVVLSDESGKAQVAVVPLLQSRVMTSTADGPDGLSFGWINRGLIASGKKLEHINAYGGEDRLWFGPEGGQFSIFFKKDAPFDLEYWYTPALIDTEPFEIIGKSKDSVSFQKRAELTNYSGTEFDIEIGRTVRVSSREDVKKNLNLKDLPGNLKVVAFESDNTITNMGNEAWNKETGLLSIWILGMFNPSPETTVVIPFNEGPESELGPVVNDAYFGKVPADKLVVKNNVLFFSGDGTCRSKIGLSPERAKPILGSYDAENNVLTIVQFTKPEDAVDYVNSMWERQDKPYAGDVVNSYNDGPPEPGKEPLGPFFEMETSSPAKELKPGEYVSHTHRTYHLQGSEEVLDRIARKTLGVSLKEIKNALPKSKEVAPLLVVKNILWGTFAAVALGGVLFLLQQFAPHLLPGSPQGEFSFFTMLAGIIGGIIPVVFLHELGHWLVIGLTDSLKVGGFVKPRIAFRDGKGRLMIGIGRRDKQPPTTVQSLAGPLTGLAAILFALFSPFSVSVTLGITLTLLSINLSSFLRGDFEIMPRSDKETGAARQRAIGAHLRQGLEYMEAGRVDEARKAFGIVLHYDQLNAIANYEIGFFSLMSGELDKAIACFTKAIEHATDYGLGNVRLAKAHNNRGMAYKAAGQLKNAIYDFSQSIKYNPYQSSALFNRGLTYAESGNLVRARRFLLMAAGIDSNLAPQVTEVAEKYGIDLDSGYGMGWVIDFIWPFLVALGGGLMVLFGNTLVGRGPGGIVINRADILSDILSKPGAILAELGNNAPALNAYSILPLLMAFLAGIVVSYRFKRLEQKDKMMRGTGTDRWLVDVGACLIIVGYVLILLMSLASPLPFSQAGLQILYLSVFSLIAYIAGYALNSLIMNWRWKKQKDRIKAKRSLEAVIDESSDDRSPDVLNIDAYLKELDDDYSAACLELKVIYRDEWELRRERLVSALEHYQEIYPDV